jgi:hypothetical protein
MAEWKHDPLIRLVFVEIGALWEEFPAPARPLLFRVEERMPAASRGDSVMGRLVNVWLFDDHGVRLAPILRREAHDFGETRDGLHRYALVLFQISTDRTHVRLKYTLGPRIAGEIEYDVLESQGELKLETLSGTLAR